MYTKYGVISILTSRIIEVEFPLLCERFCMENPSLLRWDSEFMNLMLV